MTSEMASDIFKNVLSSSPSKQGKNIAALADEDVHTVRYWLYAPGEGSCMWDEFYTSGIMAIGWGEIGDLSTFDSKDAMKIKMREVIDESLSYKNAAHATWQFANEMKIGDIVFVKKGMHQIIGRGVVMSDYEYDDTRDDEYKNIRQVDWTHNGEWPHPGQAVMKTLTDITSYTDYVEKLNSLFEDETEEDAEDVEKTYPPYTKEDFLSEVFMPERRVRAMSVFGRNQEGYPDPTAAEAIVKASKKKYLSLVYICSKYSGDVVTNTEAAKRYSRFAVGQDAIPLAPHLLLPLYMKEESERELAMFMDMVLLGRCDELWVFGGEASAGMCAEIAKAKRHGKKIRYFDSLCNETNRALEIGPERLQEER